MQNIIIANIGWDSAYRGGGVQSHQSFVVEHGAGAEDFNFRPFEDGLFYGYFRGASALGRFADRLWTIVFVSKPDPRSRLRVVGWYENASVDYYKIRPEYSVDEKFPFVTDEEMYRYCTVTKNAFLVPNDERELLILPQGHPIKNTGNYYASGGDSRDTPGQEATRERIAEWVRMTLPNFREQSRIDRPQETKICALPGIIVDDGGTARGFSSVPESEEHKALKAWACANGQRITGGPCADGEPEYSLLSGDSVDVAHLTPDALWLIEVKSRRSLRPDLLRGIYQCIKYRAVAQAQPEYAGRQINAVLLTEANLPPDLRRFAEGHDIELITHMLGQEDPA